jgi:hypothetical protein
VGILHTGIFVTSHHHHRHVTASSAPPLLPALERPNINDDFHRRYNHEQQHHIEQKLAQTMLEMVRGIQETGDQVWSTGTMFVTYGGHVTCGE